MVNDGNGISNQRMLWSNVYFIHAWVLDKVLNRQVYHGKDKGIMKEALPRDNGVDWKTGYI